MLHLAFYLASSEVKAEKLGNYRWYNRDRGMSGKDVQHADDHDGERTKDDDERRNQDRLDRSVVRPCVCLFGSTT